MIPVIISGGFGTKLWPLSRKSLPKQFLKLFKGQSLFQLNFEALNIKFSPHQIFVSTSAAQAIIAKTQAPQIPAENYLIEPEMRNQGPATGLIAAYLYKLGLADEPFMIIQVDDLREPVSQFHKMMDICDTLARQHSKYITGGFKPTDVIFGIDYLKKGERITSDSEVGVYRVAKFIWRSNQEEIRQGITSGSILAHTNHTCMTPRNFMNMLKKYRIDWYTPLANIIEGSPAEKEYSTMPPGPIEEVTEHVHADGESLVVELPFKWVDIGTWESMSEYFKQNDIYRPPQPIIEIQAQNNYVNVTNSQKVVSIVGLENISVVDTDDALLVCANDHSNQVGEVVKQLKKLGLDTIL